MMQWRCVINICGRCVRLCQTLAGVSREARASHLDEQFLPESLQVLH